VSRKCGRERERERDTHTLVSIFLQNAQYLFTKKKKKMCENTHIIMHVSNEDFVVKFVSYDDSTEYVAPSMFVTAANV